MAIQHASSPSGLDRTTVHISGEPEDVEHVMGHEQVTAVLIAGYDVTHVGDALHDGQPALRFALSADRYDVGRLVLRTGVQTEYLFEFDAEFESESAAAEFVERTNNPPVTPKVSQAVGLDFAFDGDLWEQLAKMSATHGVSVTVTNDFGPAGGWPVVNVVGLTENVLKVLTADDGYGWGFTPDEADTMMHVVTA